MRKMTMREALKLFDTRNPFGRDYRIVEGLRAAKRAAENASYMSAQEQYEDQLAEFWAEVERRRATQNGISSSRSA